MTTEPTASVEETLTTEPTTAVEAPEIAEATQATETTETATPTARPVSPLLRPASRLRLPRHNTRHREEARTPAADVTIQPDQLTSDHLSHKQSNRPRPGQQANQQSSPTETTPPRSSRVPLAVIVSIISQKKLRLAPTTPTLAPVSGRTHLTNGHNQTAQPVERDTQQVKPTPYHCASARTGRCETNARC